MANERKRRGSSRKSGDEKKSSGSRAGSRRRRHGQPGAAPSAPAGSEPISPDRAFYADALQEHLEEEYGGLGAYGDPLDAEEASEEDIAAELSHSRRIAHEIEECELPIEMEPIEEDTALELEARTVMEEEENEEWDVAPPLVQATEEAPAEKKAERPSRRGRGRGRRGRGRGRAEVTTANDAAAPGPEIEEPVESDEAVEPASIARVADLWDRISSDSAFPLDSLERHEAGEGRLPQYLYATGKTKEGSLAALIGSPDIDTPILVHGLRYVIELQARGRDVKQLVLTAPYFTDDARKAAYLVDPKRLRLRLVKHPQAGVHDAAYRAVETLRTETREVSRSFEELLAEISAPKMRRLLSRFKVAAEGALVERGGEGAVCRGGKIYFRVRGTDVLVARPREGGLQVEVLHPRGRAFRLTEETFEQTLQKVREGFDTSRGQQGLSQREPSFRLAVRQALEDKGAGLTPLDEDVAIGSRLRIDVLAARQNGTPVALQARTRLTLEDFYRGLFVFCALREQTALLRSGLGRAGASLDAGRDPELLFAFLRAPEELPSIAALLVPKVGFIRVRPERRWWEVPIQLEGLAEPALETREAPRAGTARQTQAEPAMARERTPRPVLRLEAKNPAVIVSHYDRDGIISNIVLARTLPNVASQRFMNSEDLLTLFFTPEMQANLPEVYDLYITDLRFRPSARVAPDVRDAFVDHLRSHAGAVYWFDHVYWQDVDRRDMEGAIGKTHLVIAPKERTAAEVVRNALKLRDPFSERLIEMLYGKLPPGENATWGKNWLSVIDYLRNSLDRIEAAVKPLVEGRPEEVNVALLEEGNLKEQEAEAYVTSRDFRVVIFGSYKMVVVDLPDKDTFNYTRVTQKVRERYRAQLSITAFGDAETILIANSFASRQGMNMSLIKEHLTKRFDWLKPVQGHENVITLRVVDLPGKRERLDMVINEIVRNRSLFA